MTALVRFRLNGIRGVQFSLLETPATLMSHCRLRFKWLRICLITLLLMFTVVSNWRASLRPASLALFLTPQILLEWFPLSIRPTLW